MSKNFPRKQGLPVKRGKKCEKGGWPKATCPKG